MKKYLLTSLAALGIGSSFAQGNYIATPVGVYTGVNATATTVATGGSVLVGSVGNWALAGNITSADKGGANTPSATGRAETITFDGSGTYMGATTTAGAAGFVVDGYAASTAAWTGTVLPIGNATAAYPVSIPAGTAVKAAYFAGSGSTQSVPVNGQATTEYSPYIDFPAGIPAGNYMVSYPAGFSTSLYSTLLSSGNTSAGGTNGSTAYTVLSNVAAFSASASTSTATLPASTATQLYFSTSAVVLPVTLVSFTASASGCTANLAWQTATETNSSYYAVEANTDGSNFVQVGKVGSKNSATGSTYNFSYALGSGTTYFRLKPVDVDGKFSYSATVAISGTGVCGTGLSVKVSPNPTSNLLNIQGLVGGSHISVLSISGQKITEVIASGSSQTISLNGYAKGVYIVRIQMADGTVSNVKVVKD